MFGLPFVILYILLSLFCKYGILPYGTTVLQGGVDLHLLRMEVMPMKNHFDFMELMTFGLFLLALLTFIFTFCK